MRFKKLIVALVLWVVAFAIGMGLVNGLLTLLPKQHTLRFWLDNALFLALDSTLIFLYLKYLQKEIKYFVVEGTMLAVFWIVLFVLVDLVVGVLIEGRPIGVLLMSIPAYIIVLMSGMISGLLAQAMFSD